jgi:adenylosuccinate lyase
VSDRGAFNGLFVPDHVADATSERAWLQAMLDVKAALGGAEAEVGIVPQPAACRRAVEAGRPLRDELLGDEVVRDLLGPDGIEQALDPLRYLGSADAFVDRALARYAEDGP